MKFKLLSFFLVLFTILFALCVAASDYQHLGGDNSRFLADTGVFINDYSGYTLNVKGVNAYYPPLVYDLDSDGRNEIVVYDNKTNYLSVYTFDVNSGLKLNSTVSTSCASRRISNIEIFDYDNDGVHSEIIFACEIEESIQFFQFNSSGLVNKASYSWATANHLDGEVILGCRELDKCMIAYAKYGDYQTDNPPVFVQPFNSSAVAASSVIFDRIDNGFYCFPQIRALEWIDYDMDGLNEYVFSMIKSHPSSSSVRGVIIRSVQVNDDMTYSRGFRTLNISTSGVPGGSACDGSFHVPSFATAPSLSDYYGTVGREVVIGYMKDSDEFIMQMYDQYGNEIDRFPEIVDADGIIVSNVVETRAFDDTEFGQDFCVLGFEQTEQKLDLLCASKYHGGIESEEFYWDVSGWNISTDYLRHHIMLHSANFIQTVSDDYYEFLCSYGIFYLDYHLLGVDNDLTQTWQNPVNDGSILSIDYEQNGYADIILLTETNLWYIDDGRVNSWGYIDTSNDLTAITPCLNSIWKINTTVGVTIQVSDIDGDDVCANAILYYGDVNSQNGTVQCGTEGTVFSFSFLANKTGTGYVLRLIGYDEINNATSQWHTQDFTFNVDINGVEYNDCSTTLVIAPPDESNAPGQNVSVITELEREPQLNSTFVQILSPVTRTLGVGSTIAWLLVMVGVAVGMIIGSQYYRNIDFKVLSAIIGAVEFLLLVIGVKLDFLSSGLVWTIVIICLAVIGASISKRFFPSGT